jgi:hypothetical protein
MRGVGVVAGCVALAVLVSGCAPNDRTYFRGGIGTDLYTADTATTTELQNIYLDNLCRQTLPFVGSEVPGCGQRELLPKAWALIVQAGMNDIDQRCDSYLSWLDQKKRENAAILTEISAIRVAVDALTNPGIAPGISPIALASVAAAFGLATSTLGNVNSLLLQVDHTTVQSVVFINRRDFREGVLRIPIDNKPMVIHTLRSYLSICMPMTISANINSTVTVFQQAGARAVERQPLVSTTTIGAPLTAQQTTAQPQRAFTPASPDLAQFFQELLSQTEAERTLNALCLNKNAASGKEKVALAGALVKIFKNEENSPDSKLSKQDREMFTKQTDCGVARNYFEKKLFANTTTDQARMLSAGNVKSLIMFLNRSDAGGQLDPATTLANARSKIMAVRIDPNIAKQLTVGLPPQFDNQVTPDLFAVLRQLPQR